LDRASTDRPTEADAPWDRLSGRLRVFTRHPLRNLGEYRAVRRHFKHPLRAMAIRVYPGEERLTHFELLDGRVIWLRAGRADRHIIWGNFLRDMYGLDGEERSFGLVLDVGAHIGAFAMYMAPRSKRLIAFEPAAENFELLRRNLGGPGHDHVEIHPLAVAGESGELEFHLSQKNSGGHGAFVRPENRRGEPVRVPAISLPVFLDEQGIDRVDVLKLDCQGTEYGIVESLEAWGLERIGRVVMEYHPYGEPDVVAARSEMIRRLERAGFRVAQRPRKKPDTGMIFAIRD
jgi:FkbM family methyltransferase